MNAADLLGNLKQRYNGLRVDRNILAKDPAYNSEKIAENLKEARGLESQIEELEAQEEAEILLAKKQDDIKTKIRNLRGQLHHVPVNATRTAAILAEIKTLEAQYE